MISSFSVSINSSELNGDNAINVLQLVNNELSTIFKSFGSSTLDDLLFICFGTSDAPTYAKNAKDTNKFELLKKYFHPISYKISNKLNVVLDCEDASTTVKSFYVKVYGMQLSIMHPSNKRGLVITGVVDDILVDILNNEYINDIKAEIIKNKPIDDIFASATFNTFLDSLTLKDYFIYNIENIYSKYAGMMCQLNTINQKTVHVIVKEFVGQTMFLKRNTIMILLTNSMKNDNQYLAYLLYDLLSNDSSGVVDTQEQMNIFDSFPHSIKNCFRLAMKKTVQYTTELSEYDTSKIPIEQQICLMNAPDTVKEKAFQKLKDVKSKSDDSCSKARQYLDGILKIPFGIIRKEPILRIIGEIKQEFATLNKTKKEYTNIEIINQLTKPSEIEMYKAALCVSTSKTQRIELNTIIESISDIELTYTNKTKTLIQLSANINQFIEHCFKKNEFKILFELMTNQTSLVISKHLMDHINILIKYNGISENIKSIGSELDIAVYGHSNAKRQIEHIIAQWINGKQDGYCFGFEGPPGVGKTSLAKCGLSTCLKNENGEGRPFAMIQMGGDSNGSSLHGHNYTYVGSTWGSIVQIIIDKKCMNPIIFIDEVDKISKTEHGKEIVGILTHLLDPSQNDSFQDRYFTGIDLNLSNALFILSYNDPALIDPILLDRIHRIKFDSLSTDEKFVIANKYIIPEICSKMGLSGMIQIQPDALTVIIDQYTNESGVRKLKEILFEIIAEINLNMLKSMGSMDIPIIVTAKDVKDKYLKDKSEQTDTLIHSVSSIGTMNGLWANSSGKGGIIPIQACFFPSNSTFELKLTGMQGDVMKESMNVALSLAWKLTSTDMQDAYMKHKMGIHIHCPDGSTPKDGPSAGACITTAIYSLLNNVPIRNTSALTGEINLQGNITMIGGLQLKVLGAIKAGVTEIMYPVENEKDFVKIMSKYEKQTAGIKFHGVKTIQDVFNVLFS
jgi:ATP-dependent Lon protease